MHTRRPTARRAPDGRLVFALTAFVLGSTMMTGSLLGPQPVIDLPLREPTWPSPGAAAVRTRAALPLGFTARHDLAARVRNRARSPIPAWGRNVVMAPRQDRVPCGLDLCCELLMLASLQRRTIPERPAGHYAAPEPGTGTWCGSVRPAKPRAQGPDVAGVVDAPRNFLAAAPLFPRSIQ